MKRFLFFAVTALFCSAVSAVDLDRSDTDWLLARQIELEVTVLQDKSIPPIFKERIKAHFYRFAFEYWLKTRGDSKLKSLFWHGRIRDIITREAKSVSLLSDPLLIQTNFVNGRIFDRHSLVPIANLDLINLTESDYRKLAKDFGNSFCDFAEVFPVAPIQQTNFVFSPDGALDINQANLLKTLKNKSWRVLGRDRLPIYYQKEPFNAFSILTPDAQAYFLPAFIRMCEREPDILNGLLRSLLEYMTSASKPSKDLRSRLTERQRACVAAFFHEAFPIDDQNRSKIDALIK